MDARPDAAARTEVSGVRQGDFPRWRRISWGAIFAGVFVALGIQVLLTLLGIAIGFASIDPWGEQDPAGLTIGAGIWLVITGIISLFCAGWTTGRLSGEPRGIDRAINGLVMWGVVLVATIYLTTVTASALIGGAVGILRTGATAIGAAAPAVAEFGPLADIQSQIQQQLEQYADTTPQARQQLMQDFQTIGSALREAWDRGSLTAQSRERVITILVQRGNMSRSEAESTVNDWVSRVRQARRDAPHPDTLRRIAEDAANRAAQAAAWIFFVLLLAAAAAVAGSLVAKPDYREYPVART